MDLQTNPQLDLARHYVSFTNKNIFLTGKAGTGKTTFLHQIKQETPKRLVIVAPTGVAAINAGGVTIHSFFQLPFGPLVPGATQDTAKQRKFTREKIDIIRCLDLLVIDEISMVRADVLDAIDEVLRRYKNAYLPFGGVQLLMIGDLHQLPPVVKDLEWDLLRGHFHTAYFFGSHALRESRPVVIELTHIFRQADTYFIDLLNRVRDNQIDRAVLDTLNSRYIPHFQPDDAAGYITLCSHNAAAHAINSQKLAALAGVSQQFSAVVDGDFPEFSYPTDATLELKVGAQVMFVKNDTSRDKLFYNGKIGKITKFEGETIWVKCAGDCVPIPVSRVEWRNVKYSLDEKSKEIKEEELGKFNQFPLKLAWAITIHKSQGLTFERVIIDAKSAFAHGQVYVALSRCKTFEGIVLSTPIVSTSIKTDSVVRDFSQNAHQNAPTERHLEHSKREFQAAMLAELFDFKPIQQLFDRTIRLLLEHDRILQPGAVEQFRAVERNFYDKICDPATKFLPVLQFYVNEPPLPEENENLRGRLAKASPYFSEHLLDGCFDALKKFAIITDNKSVKEQLREALDHLKKAIFVKWVCFGGVGDGFSTNDYLRAKANAELDYKNGIRPPANVNSAATATPQTVSSTDEELLEDFENLKLFKMLKDWREEKALEREVPAFAILHNRAIFEIIRLLPTDMLALKNIKGIGKRKMEDFGVEIVLLVRQYCQSNGISTDSELL